MEKEFVTYGLAVKLKVIGFDKPSPTFYTAKGILYRSIDFNGYTTDKLYTNECLAPTYSQAFIWVMQFPPLNKWRCNIALYSDGTYSIKDGKDAIYEYLSAESCLEKLIEFIEREK